MSLQSAEPLVLSHGLLHLVHFIDSPPQPTTIKTHLKSSLMASGVPDAWGLLFAGQWGRMQRQQGHQPQGVQVPPTPKPAPELLAEHHRGS